MIRILKNAIPTQVYLFFKNTQLKYRIRFCKDKKLKIVLGAGGVFQKTWIPTSIETINIPDEKSWSKFLKTESIDALLAEHVWEHLNYEDSLKAAKIVFNFLKPGGYFRIAVPDGYHPNEKYIKGVDVTKDEAELRKPDSHKVLYNYKSFSKVFAEAGFELKLLEYFDENGKFHFSEWNPEDGLIYRSSRYKFLRKEVSILNMDDFTSLIIDAVKI